MARAITGRGWSVPTAASLLGFAGAVPFLGLCALGFVPAVAGIGRDALLVYAIAILAFMGGIHWGLAMAQDEATLARLGASVLPALLAWAAHLAGPVATPWLLAAGFALLLAYDLRQVARGRAPGWYPQLRWPLTLIVVTSLLVTALG